MTNQELSKSYLNSALQILKEAQTLNSEKVWHLVVRRCQECVELCLKGLLRQAGLEVPRLHDVGFLFRQESHRFPNFPIDQIVSISRGLKVEREISFYGDDMTETPPEKLYSVEDASEALENARFIVNLIKTKDSKSS